MPEREQPEADFRKFLIEIREKDPDAWARLNFVFRRTVRHWITREHGGNPYLDQADLEQIFNDAFSTLFEILCDERRALELGTYADLRNYMFGIVKNKARELIRERRKERVRPNPDSTAGTELEASRLNPDQAAGFENRELVEKITEELTEQEKIILYRFYAGEPIRNIARSLNITEVNCRVIKFRALERLRESVKKNPEREQGR